MDNTNKCVNDCYLPFSKGAGGDIQECEFLNSLGLNVECQSQNFGKDMVHLQSDYKNPYGQNPFCVKIEECENLEELLFKIRKYAETQTRLHSPTINRAIRRLISMADRNQEFPVDYFNLRLDQWIYNMTWYKENVYNSQTGENFFGLKERKEAFYLLLDACGIPQSYFPYQLPSRPKHKPIKFPNPDKAYDITTYNFFNDKELDWYWQFAHLYNFIVGPRSPSEMAIMRREWIDWDSYTIEFPQPKLHGEIRKIVLPEVFIKGKTRKSLKNYVDYHLSKFTNQFSDDFLFVSPWSGKPFSPPNLGKYLSLTGKMVVSSFYGYQGRHFCATGTLIKKWIEKHPDPIESTKNFMGHDRRKTTERYTALAEEYYGKYSYDWFKRTLKGRTNCWGKYAEKSKQAKNTFVSHGKPSRDQNSPAQIRTGD